MATMTRVIRRNSPSVPSNGMGLQLRQTALTLNAWTATPAAGTIPWIDWTSLFGVSCKPLLGACSLEEGSIQRRVLHSKVEANRNAKLEMR